jgi:hypothetical protein
MVGAVLVVQGKRVLTCAIIAGRQVVAWLVLVHAQYYSLLVINRNASAGKTERHTGNLQTTALVQALLLTPQVWGRCSACRCRRRCCCRCLCGGVCCRGRSLGLCRGCCLLVVDHWLLLLLLLLGHVGDSGEPCCPCQGSSRGCSAPM